MDSPVNLCLVNKMSQNAIISAFFFFFFRVHAVPFCYPLFDVIQQKEKKKKKRDVISGTSGLSVRDIVGITLDGTTEIFIAHNISPLAFEKYQVGDTEELFFNF